MAKKTFNIKSTLGVQPKQFSVDDVESAIKKIHEAKEPIPSPGITEPIKSRIGAKKIVAPRTAPRGGKVVEEVPVRKVRLSVDIDPAMHKRLKIKAIEHDSDIMHYVAMLIARDLAK